MRTFSSSWKSSVKPKKQRKYRFEAPLHIKRKLLRVHLSSDLKGKQKMRNAAIRTGDKVKVIKGDYFNLEGKVERVDMKDLRIYVAGVERAKKDGTKALVGISPSSLMITELNMDDKRRFTIQKSENKEGKKTPKSAKTERTSS